ncbi:MAG TPA: nitronate monooxygenase [Solirubrobacterales bacterium]
MGAFLERIGVERPVVQAGMGGGLAGHELAAAVSDAGGLGTIGILGPDRLREEIAAARRLTDRPIAVNLLSVLARAAHFEAAEGADVVVTFWGRPRRRTSRIWIHQVGSVEEAQAARAAGADAVIAQGVEAGGHVRGTVRAAELLERIRTATGPGYPVLSAGGVVSAAEVGERMDAGAEAVVAGTRFLMSEECAAHPAYKERLIGARETMVTELFGLGWPAPHRVVPNAATERWLRGDRRGPAWVRAIHRLSSVGASRMPIGLQVRLAASQRPGRPLFGPAAATADGAASLVDAGPLYAGECVADIDDIRPAGELVRDLASGRSAGGRPRR